MSTAASTALGKSEYIRALAAAEGLEDLVPLAAGVEFLVFRCTHPVHGAAVLRIPRARVFSTANNPDVDPFQLLDQELRTAGWLGALNFPVAEPLEMLRTTDGLPVLLSRFVESDDDSPNWAAVGALVRRLHELPIPRWRMALQGDAPFFEVIGARLAQRMERLRTLVPGLDPLPPAAELADRLSSYDGPSCLLHLDLRGQNLLCRGGVVEAVIDWSNAFVGDPRLELARLCEYARIAENGLPEDDILAGYQTRSSMPSDENGADQTRDLLYRPDAAVMLALVFRAVAPNPTLAEPQVARVPELSKQLSEAW